MRNVAIATLLKDMGSFKVSTEIDKLEFYNTK